MAATTVIGAWSTVKETFSDLVHYRWTGAGVLTGSTWKTPNIGLHGACWRAFLFIHGAGDAVNGATPGDFDAWVHFPNLTGNASGFEDILPRSAVNFVNTGGSNQMLSDPAGLLDSSSNYTNGWHLNNIINSTSPQQIITGHELFFIYAPNDTVGDGEIQFMDLYMERYRG